jgi:PAS domain S-box-containing protein
VIDQWLLGSNQIEEMRGDSVRPDNVPSANDDRLHQILDAAEVGAWQWDIATGSFIWYGKTIELLGVEPEEFAGTYEAFLKTAHPDDRAAINLAVKRSVETGAEFRVEFRVIRHQDDVRWLLAKGQVQSSPQCGPERMMGIIYDISSRKQVEEARQELLAHEQAGRAEAEANARAKDEFLGVISHELRTPLSAMLGWAEVLRARQPGDAVYERALQTIERNAERQSQLIEDLLDTTRILSGKLRIEAQPLYLDALLEESLDVVRPTAEAKEIELIASFDPPSSLILGDANRLQQVFWNLLSNAIKFTEPGGRVEARLVRDETEVRIVVSDTGSGIAPDFLPHVFDLFRQADSSSARRQGGLGLGLALARRLVEMHGGKIRADSPGEGMGATFTISLPARSGNRTTAEMKAVEVKKTLGLSGKPNLDGLRVLVVDDEADARDLLVIRLQQYGAEVIAAASVDAAMEALSQPESRPDAIVSDIAMPGEDGYSLIRRVRALDIEEVNRIPAIALTAYSRTKDRTRALSAGFQMHVPKPVNATELAHAIVSVIGRFNHN